MFDLFRFFIAPFAIAVGVAVLTRTWQDRAWRIQQRQAGAIRDYDAVHELWKAFDRDAASRLYTARRLLSSFEPGSKIDRDDALKEYRSEVKKWNENLYSLYNRAKMLLGWSYTKRLEDEIHFPFVHLGRALNLLVREFEREASWADIEPIGRMALDIQVSISGISSEILKHVESRRSEISHGHQLQYVKSDLEMMSTFQLCKLLLVKSVQRTNFPRPL